jgi:N4-gp56 family major capsid protein
MDPAAQQSRTITYTEALDAEPNWNVVAEGTTFMRGAHLDQRTVNIGVEIYGDVIKYGDFFAKTQGIVDDFRGLVQGKLGQLVVDELDILARNAHLAHPSPYYGGDATSRATLVAADIMTPAMVRNIRVDLEEKNLIDWNGAEPQNEVVCITTPRVIEDLRSGSTSPWMEVQAYNDAYRIFNGEMGKWEGVRFVKSNRMLLRNMGDVVAQTQLAAVANEGSGAQATDSIYTYGQSGATNYITVDSNASFTVGMYVTIHSLALGTSVLESDGAQETRRVVGKISTDKLVLDFPLMKQHAIDDYVTNAIDLHASSFQIGPSVVWGLAEEPNVFPAPKIDDLQMINRFGWRMFGKFQQFTPERQRLVLTTGSAGL